MRDKSEQPVRRFDPGSLAARAAIHGVLDQAFADVCEQRRHAPPDDDVWWLRSTWAWVRPRLERELRDGTYRFSPPRLLSLTLGPLRETELVERWSAPDAVVLRALMEVIGPLCEQGVPREVTSVRHRGGIKGAVRKLRHHLRESTHLTRVFRTDVKSYYQSIDLVRMQLVASEVIADPAVRRILWQALERCIDQDAEVTLVKRGISKGSPLSPLLGALYLKSLDEAMGRLAAQGRKLLYIRYMDDILVLADTPRTLRKAIRCIHEQFAAAGLTLHPDKTSIGKVSAGFDFLGYRFDGSSGRLGIAPAQQQQFLARLHCLYETSTTGGPDAATSDSGFTLLPSRGAAPVGGARREEGAAWRAVTDEQRRPSDGSSAAAGEKGETRVRLRSWSRSGTRIRGSTRRPWPTTA